LIFVDTGAWFAAHVPNDAEHERARAWLRENTLPLLTTDYVVSELLTLLKVRGEDERALLVGERMFRGDVARLEWVTKEDVLEAWSIFRRHPDKAWSFTDCVSRVVMERLGITQAFAFDQHFRQFGTVSVVPA
jgi:predicted nucleic acid-binding protein